MELLNHSVWNEDNKGNSSEGVEDLERGPRTISDNLTMPLTRISEFDNILKSNKVLLEGKFRRFLLHEYKIMKQATTETQQAGPETPLRTAAATTSTRGTINNAVTSGLIPPIVSFNNNVVKDGSVQGSNGSLPAEILQRGCPSKTLPPSTQSSMTMTLNDLLKIIAQMMQPLVNSHKLLSIHFVSY